MSATLLTLLSYTVAATLLAGLTMWVGRERQVRWRAVEYFLVFVPFIFVYVHVRTVFGDIDTGVAEMELGTIGTVFIAATGGIVGGLSLLPRLWVAQSRVKPTVLTCASSTLVGLLCLKMFFLMVVIVNPRALLTPAAG